MGQQENRNKIGRRSFVTGAMAAATGPLWGTSAAKAAAPSLVRAAGKSVAVFGAGMGGLSAAHELAERGFQVTVYERKALGGKSRSIPVPGTGTGGRQDLPGEHGFRFFPGFYQNLPDTMSRIPYGTGSGTVRDNLVPASLEVIAYKGKELRVPVPGNIGGVLTPDAIRDYLRSALTAVTTVPPPQVEFFASKLVTFVTSGPRRRLGQWENMGFADFIKASIMSQEDRDLLVRLFTASLVAAQPNKANTRTMGLMFEALVYSGLGLGPYGPPDRVLGRPSNDVWLTPWIGYLTSLGVQFKVGSGTVLARRLRDELRGRHGHRLPVPRPLGLEHSRRPVRQDRPAVHPAGDRPGGPGPGPRGPARWCGAAARLDRTVLVRGSGDHRRGHLGGGNDEPLLINTPASWTNRPSATTQIPNLFLAADFVRNSINLATMEGGNEAGRMAANGILDAAGSSASRARLFSLYLPREFKLLYDTDDARYLLGLPNQFDLLSPYWPGR
ncbi:FAD-dependent oxidoreductase [Nonomuraea sp. NPDC049750]|uniref:FAD-dependent oxidoreductase n=1 Tax=Nonomuraea sp. NPDC049750 TaxID=3154738 RepID=UPI0033C22756